MTESERLKLHIWSLDESRDGPEMAELRHVIAGMVAENYPSPAYAALCNMGLHSQLAMQSYNSACAGSGQRGGMGGLLGSFAF